MFISNPQSVIIIKNTRALVLSCGSQDCSPPIRQTRVLEDHERATSWVVDDHWIE